MRERGKYYQLQISDASATRHIQLCFDSEKHTREKDMRNREGKLNKLCHKPKEFPPFKAVQYFPLEEIIATHLEPGMA